MLRLSDCAFIQRIMDNDKLVDIYEQEQFDNIYLIGRDEDGKAVIERIDKYNTNLNRGYLCSKKGRIKKRIKIESFAIYYRHFLETDRITVKVLRNAKITKEGRLTGVIDLSTQKQNVPIKSVILRINPKNSICTTTENEEFFIDWTNAKRISLNYEIIEEVIPGILGIKSM